eukprot:13035611-Alexandrium_andersonii.AAC.1
METRAVGSGGVFRTFAEHAWRGDRSLRGGDVGVAVRMRQCMKLASSGERKSDLGSSGLPPGSFAKRCT